MCQVSGSGFQVLGVRCRVSGPRFQAPDVKNSLPSPLGSPISGPRWGRSDPRNRGECPARAFPPAAVGQAFARRRVMDAQCAQPATARRRVRGNINVCAPLPACRSAGVSPAVARASRSRRFHQPEWDG
jgi:hypothetical protein